MSSRTRSGTRAEDGYPTMGELKRRTAPFARLENLEGGGLYWASLWNGDRARLLRRAMVWECLDLTAFNRLIDLKCLTELAPGP